MYETVTTDREISIHALRVEGDSSKLEASSTRSVFLSTPSGWRATVSKRVQHRNGFVHFYPRPPGGGRQVLPAATARADQFLSTPSGWRATRGILVSRERYDDFYPRPPGGGRQQKRTKFLSVFAQKGEEFASLRRGKRKICRWRFKKDKFWVLIWCEGSGKSVCASASHCG